MAKKKRGDEPGSGGSKKSRPAPAQGRSHTLSIAVPGSMIAAAQSMELATKLVGQIARAAAIYQVDEVVVIDDGGARCKVAEIKSGADFLARVLQYLETPQYLRRSLIPVHSDLRLAGLLPPLDAPHQPRAHEWLAYREGAVVEDFANPGSETSSLANVGLDREVTIDQPVPPGTRVTVAMAASDPGANAPLTGRLVSPSEPREAAGLYWGYTTRVARGISAVFTECPFEEGYDVTIGTSEHGAKLDSEFDLPPYQHILVAFGGLEGLESAVQADPALEVKDPSCIFDHYLNVCPGQGSRTIRTEEAVLISLCSLSGALRDAHA